MPFTRKRSVNRDAAAAIAAVADSHWASEHLAGGASISWDSGSTWRRYYFRKYLVTHKKAMNRVAYPLRVVQRVGSCSSSDGG